MVGLDRLREWMPRLLAPVAFFVAATVLILLVQNALSSDEQTATPTVTQPAPGTTTTGSETTGETGTTERRRRRHYRVKEGDLLETIAAEYNTSVERLLELNPGIDPQALTVGQRIRVR
jgi:LysM repeat protein